MSDFEAKTLMQLVREMPENGGNDLCHGMVVFFVQPDGKVRMRSTFPERILKEIISNAYDEVCVKNNPVQTYPGRSVN